MGNRGPILRRVRQAMALVAVVGLVTLAACSDDDRDAADGDRAASTTTTTAPIEPIDPRALPTTVEFPADAGGGAASTTEVVQVVDHAGRLWASTSQWMAPTPAGGALWRKDDADAPWEVAWQTDQLRVMALGSFDVPAEHNGGEPAAVLLVQGRTGDTSELRWLVGDGTAPTERFELEPGADARSVGAHDEGDAFAFYAGVRPTGLLRGAWDADARAIDWSSTPELVTTGRDIDQKVTAFASCGGSAWATVRTTLYRRVDGPVADGAPRWVEAYSYQEDNPDNSGLRGLTCIVHDDHPALLVAREGSGTVLRFDDLNTDPSAPLAPPVVEVEVRDVIDETLRAWGEELAVDGPGAVGYVIPAYNEWLALDDELHVTGVEWNYQDLTCASGRTCQPQRTFDAAACLLRREGGDEPAWSMACLGGGATPADAVDEPVEAGQAFVAVRALRPAPWDPDQLWLAGYDANFVPSAGTGWLGTTSRALVIGPWADT